MIDASMFFRKKEEKAPSAQGDAARNGHTVLELSLDLIRANPYQPRKNFDPAELAELSASIEQVGLIQPVVVKPDGEGYELIVGERRFRAAKMAGLERIPALVVNAGQDDQQLIALMENIHRSDLSSIEEAESLSAILERTGMTQGKLAKKLGRSQSSLANKIRLLKLDPRVKQLLLDRKLGERQARALLSLDGEDQYDLAQRAVKEDLSSAQLERIAQRSANLLDRSHSEKGKIKKAHGGLYLSGPDGPAGELLDQLSAAVEGGRKKGIPVFMKIKELAKNELMVEIRVDVEE